MNQVFKFRKSDKGVLACDDAGIWSGECWDGAMGSEKGCWMIVEVLDEGKELESY